MLIDLQYCSNVATPVTIVRRRPYSHQFFWKYFLVSLHYQLMSPADQRDVISAIELFDSVFSEKIPSASGADEPALNLIWVWPHQVAHGSNVGNFLFSVKWPDVIDVLNVGRESTMHTENFIINNCSKWKVVKDVSTVLPNIETAVFPETLVIKSIDLSNLSWFVIAPDEKELVFVPDFIGE